MVSAGMPGIRGGWTKGGDRHTIDPVPGRPRAPSKPIGAAAAPSPMPPTKKKQAERGAQGRKRAAAKKGSSVRVTQTPRAGGGGRPPRVPFHQVLARLALLVPAIMRARARKVAAARAAKAKSAEEGNDDTVPGETAAGPAPEVGPGAAGAGARARKGAGGRGGRVFDPRIRKALIQGIRGRLREVIPIGRAMRIPPPQAMRFAARNMMSRLPLPYLERMRLAAALLERPAELGKWISIVGKEILDRVRAEGRPVVLLNSHFGVSNVVPIVIARLGIPVTAVTFYDNLARYRLKPCAGLTILSLRQGFAGRVVVGARRALARGEVLHMSGDGPQGKNRVAVPFLGGRRQFAVGFARIAAATRAVVLPVFAPVDERGKVRVIIGEPLDDGGDGGDEKQRATRLLASYVKLLENQWRKNPANVRPKQLLMLMSGRKRAAKKAS